MRTGKLPEHTLKRSVIHPIRYHNADMALGAGVGHDGAVFGDMVTAVATTAFSYTGNELYALDNALNNVVAAGGNPWGVSAAVLLPEHSEEAELRRIMDNLAKRAEEYQVEIVAGHTELVPSVVQSTVMITAYGRRIWDNRHREVRAGMDIVMTKWGGMYGGAVLAHLKAEELAARYPKSYIEAAAGYMRNTSLLAECAVLKALAIEKPGCIYAAHDVSNGGVFGALWQMLAACNRGADIWLREVPVKQEIIEVSDYFDINPYMMNGQGSLLLIAEDGAMIREAMEGAGIRAAVIGTITDKKDRRVIIGEEERFLVPPRGDALNAVFYGQPVPV